MLLILIIIKTPKYFSFLLIRCHFQMSASFGLLLKSCFHDHASYTDRHKAWLSGERGVRWRRDEQRHIHGDDVTGSGDCGIKSWFCSLVTGERFEVPPAVCVGKAVLRAQMKLLPPSPTTRTTEGTWLHRAAVTLTLFAFVYFLFNARTV